MRKILVQRSILATLKSEETFLALLWTVPVFMKLVSMQGFIISIVAFAISVYNFKIIIFRPFYVLIALPFLTLISPMLGFLKLPIGEILLSDLFFLLLVIQMIVIIVRKKYIYNNLKFYKYLFLFSALFIISMLLGKVNGDISNFKSILYFVQLFVIYFYTINYSKNDLDKQKIINAWIFAVILACFILIQAFISGQNLQTTLIDENTVVEDKSKLQSLFQATYYYSGFIFLVGISALILLIKLFLISSRVKKLLYFVFFILFLITLILINNKTVIFSFLFVIVIVLVSLISNNYINRKKFLINFCVTILTLLFVMLPFILNFLDENQFNLMLERFTSSSSLVARLEIYFTSFSQWFTNPFQIFFGMGPDFLDTSGVPEKAIKFKKSLVTGIEEGTVDSGWISYLIELGIISFSILVHLFYKATKGAYEKFKFQNILLQVNPIGIYVYASLLFLAVTLSTQMLGYTKTSWFPFQLFLFGLMFSTHRKNLTIEKNS